MFYVHDDCQGFLILFAVPSGGYRRCLIGGIGGVGSNAASKYDLQDHLDNIFKLLQLVLSSLLNPKNNRPAEATVMNRRLRVRPHQIAQVYIFGSINYIQY